jgi:hypothetical protein
MKFKILVIVLLTIGSINGIAQKTDSLYGKIKSVREQVNNTYKKDPNILFHLHSSMEGGYFVHEYQREFWKNQRMDYNWFNTPVVGYINYLKEYDNSGKLITENYYYDNQNLVIGYDYEYNELGDLIVQNVIDNQSQGSEINDYEKYYILYSYDEKKNVIFEKTCFSDNSHVEKFRKFDESDNLKYEFTYNSLYPDESQIIYNYYDKKDNLVETGSILDKKNSLSQRFKYNSLNLKTVSYFPFIKTIEETDDKNLVLYPGGFIEREMKYDDQHRLVQEDHFEMINSLLPKFRSSIRWVYSGDKLMLLKHQDRDSTVFRKEIHEYNRKGNKTNYSYITANLKFADTIIDNNYYIKYDYNKRNLLKGITYKNSSKNFNITFKYKFDSKGNWIKRWKYIDGVELAVWTRDIIYYE